METALPRAVPNAVATSSDSTPILAITATQGSHQFDRNTGRAAITLDDLEHVTLLPGRRQAIKADIALIIKEFKDRVSTDRARQAEKLHRNGGFSLFKAIFCDLSFSMVIEAVPGEDGRDLFQYVCGTAWSSLLNTDSLITRVGIVFLVYLLFHSQSPLTYRRFIPVNIPLLKALCCVRRECLSGQVFLECPAIIQMLSKAGALSVGMCASVRNMHFDRLGRVCGRMCASTSETCETFHEQPQAQGDINGGIRRHFVTSSFRESGVLPAPVGEETLDIGSIRKDVKSYSAQFSNDPGSQESHWLSQHVDHLAAAVANYRRGTSPAPRDIRIAKGLSSSPQPLEQEVVQSPKQAGQRKRKRRRVIQSDSDSGDSLRERTMANASLPRSSAEADAMRQEHRDIGALPPLHPVLVRHKKARQSRLLGIEQAMGRHLGWPASEGAVAGNLSKVLHSGEHKGASVEAATEQSFTCKPAIVPLANDRNDDLDSTSTFDTYTAMAQSCHAGDAAFPLGQQPLEADTENDECDRREEGAPENLQANGQKNASDVPPSEKPTQRKRKKCKAVQSDSDSGDSVRERMARTSLPRSSVEIYSTVHERQDTSAVPPSSLASIRHRQEEMFDIEQAMEECLAQITFEDVVARDRSEPPREQEGAASRVAAPEQADAKNFLHTNDDGASDRAVSPWADEATVGLGSFIVLDPLGTQSAMAHRHARDATLVVKQTPHESDKEENDECEEWGEEAFEDVEEFDDVSMASVDEDDALAA